jgi:hypothetical protein
MGRKREREVGSILEEQIKWKIVGKVREALLWRGQEERHFITRFPGFARSSF